MPTKRRLVTLCAVSVFALSFAGGAAADANPNASCAGQFTASVAPQSAGFVGENVSFEAQNPEVVGTTAFGLFISTVATTPHNACP
jgi:hypothetical protein